MTNQQYIKLSKAIEALTEYVEGIDKLSPLKAEAHEQLHKLGLSYSDGNELLDLLAVKYYPRIDFGDVLINLIKRVEGSVENV